MAAYVSVQNGPWDDPATWGGSGYPSSAGDTATINHVVTYNVSSAAELGAIAINSGGVLSFDPSVDTKLTLGHVNLTINNGGELRVGKSDGIIPKTKTAEILFNTTADGQRGIYVDDGGKLNIFGDPDYYGNDDDTVLASDWDAGQTFTVIGDFTSKWATGQEIYVHRGQNYGNYITDLARFTIASLAPNGANTDITINEAAPGVTFKAGGAVINASRNVKLGKAGASVALGIWNSNRPYVKSNTASGDSNVNVSAACFTGFQGIGLRPSETIKKSVVRNGYWSVPSGTSLSYGFLCEDVNLLSVAYACHGGNASFNGLKIAGSIVGLNIVTNSTFENTEIFACLSGVYAGGNCYFSETVYVYANGTGLSNVPSGLFRGTLGKSPAAGNPEMLNTADVQDAKNQYSPSGLVLSGAGLPASGLTVGRNNEGYGRSNRSVRSEHHAGVRGAHRTYSQFGDIIKNTSVLRATGGNSSLEVIPLSNCNADNVIEVFEWTEHDVPASLQSRSVFMKGEGWSSFPTSSEFYIEAEYFSGSSGVARATVASTAVLADNTNWTEFSVSFTPGQAGPVKYRAYLKKYQAGAKVYVDAELQRNNKRPLRTKWARGSSALAGEKPYSLFTPADFEDVEEGIIFALEAGVPELKTVATYAGQLEEEVERLPVKFPAAFVVYGGSSLKWTDGPNHEETVRFSVLVASKNLRGQEASRKGTNVEQGAYRLIKNVCDALANQDFGLDIGKLRPLRVSPVKSAMGITAFAVDFETAFRKAY